MALIIVLDSARAPFLQGQPQLRAIQWLDLTLLVKDDNPYCAIVCKSFQRHYTGTPDTTPSAVLPAATMAW